MVSVSSVRHLLLQVGLWLLAIGGLYVGCAPGRDVSISPSASCELSLDTNSPLWKASFARSESAKGARACLVLLEQQGGVQQTSLPVFLYADGLVSSWDDTSQDYKKAPTFTFDAAPPSTKRSFRLHVLPPTLFASVEATKRYQEHVDQCQSVGQASPCDKSPTDPRCWFSFSFELDLAQQQTSLRCQMDQPEPTQETTGENTGDGGARKDASAEPDGPPDADAALPEPPAPPEQPADAAQCATNLDCPVDSICSVDRVCVEGECDPKGPIRCPSDQICASNYKCARLGCVVSEDCPNNALCKNAQCTPKQCAVGIRRCPLGKICADFTCIQRVSCRTQSDCPGGNTEACLKFFIEDTQGYCTSKCQVDTDCPGGQECRDGGDVPGRYCLQPAANKLGQSCAPPDNDCIKPFECVRESDQDTQGTCLQPCTKLYSEEQCPTNAICEPSSTAGVCLAYGTKQVGEPCSLIKKRCVKGAVCIEANSQGGFVCLGMCTPGVSPSGCSTGLTCLQLRRDPQKGVCVQEVTRSEDQSCITAEEVCGMGLICVQADQRNEKRCLRECTNNADCTNGKTCSGTAKGISTTFCL